MQKRNNTIITTIAIFTGLAATIGLGIAGTAAAGRLGDDSEAPITGDALTKATDAALAHTGGGTVTDTEVDDEDSYYEVEVTLDSGDQLDVQLDREFHVLGANPDDESHPEDD